MKSKKYKENIYGSYRGLVLDLDFSVLTCDLTWDLTLDLSRET